VGKLLRLFVAVDPAPAVRDALRGVIARVRPLAPRAKWVDPDAYHLTLAFLGDTAEDVVPAITAALAGVAARHAPIAARFSGGGAFGGRRPRVLWAGLTDGAVALGAVYRDLAPALGPFGYTPDHAELTPHLTLARAGDRGGDPALTACAASLAAEDFGPTLLDALILYQSDLSPKGARYTALARLLFGG
jgi:2'-5' RNA ligase